MHVLNIQQQDEDFILILFLETFATISEKTKEHRKKQQEDASSSILTHKKKIGCLLYRNWSRSLQLL